jgi:uncharacterized RDD family membrane protein YckC
VLHQQIGLPQVALFIVIAMLYVTLARGRLIGSSVMIHEAQYPRVFAIVKRACAALEIPMPLVFVQENYNVPVAALGFGEPYSLVISSNWIEHFEDDELAFAIGRELGHIAAGHTRFNSLLSVNGNENAIVALIFGGWLRTCALTCDKIGLLVCGSLDAATRSIAIASFHHFGRHVNVTQFAEQGREIASDGVLRMGEWLGSEPYATQRIAEMQRFIRSEQYRICEDWFLREERLEPPSLATAGSTRVTRADCAGWWRRAWSIGIDLIVVSALVMAFNDAAAKHAVDVSVTETPAPVATASAAAKVPAPGASVKPKPRASDDDNDDDDQIYASKGLQVNYTGFHVDPKTFAGGPALGWLINIIGGGGFPLLALYMAVLVGFTGQTFGMMIVGLRVVRTDFRQPGIARAFWRYTVGWLLWPIVAMLSPFMPRVMLHDRWSGTRLIRSERLLARSTAPKTATATAG